MRNSLLTTTATATALLIRIAFLSLAVNESFSWTFTNTRLLGAPSTSSSSSTSLSLSLLARQSQLHNNNYNGQQMMGFFRCTTSRHCRTTNNNHLPWKQQQQRQHQSLLILSSERSSSNKDSSSSSKTSDSSDKKNDQSIETSSTSPSSSSLSTDKFTETSATLSSSSSSSANVEMKTISDAWVSSFDESGRSLVEEDNKQRIDQMGEFDANPAYQSDRMEQMRAAIQARTASLGMEKSKISQQLIQEASARAAAGQRNTNNYSLDLTKITTSATPNNNIMREEIPEGLPSMFYDPEEQMSDEEKLEADPDGQLTVWQQALKEFQNAKWPTFWSAMREVGVMIIVVLASAALIIGWDRFLRDVYTDWGFIPRLEDIGTGRSLDGLELPDGWTNNMSDQDLMRLENEMSSSGAKTILNTLPSTSSTSLPQL